MISSHDHHIIKASYHHTIISVNSTGWVQNRVGQLLLELLLELLLLLLLLLLPLLLLLLPLLLLHVFNHVLIRGREAPPYNYVINTCSRRSGRSSRRSGRTRVRKKCCPLKNFWKCQKIRTQEIQQIVTI